jgi:hypothetical protein
MIPLLSGLSIVVLALGLVAGSALGLAYWFLSPSISEIQASQLPPVPSFTGPEGGPYQSTVSVQIMSRGDSYTLKDIQRAAEYYAAKMRSLSFLEFLNQKVHEERPESPHSPVELGQLLRIRYDYKSDNPAIEIRATSPDDEEVFLLTSIIAEAFEEYLIEEGRNLALEDYQSKLNEMESVRAALVDAEKELAALSLVEAAYDLSLDEAYVALDAKVVALEAELEIRARELATLIAEGDTGQDYIDALTAIERASTALSEARKERSDLQARATMEDFENRLVYVNANAKVQRLSRQLDDLAKSLASSSVENTEAPGDFIFRALGQPSLPIYVPPERVKGRNALMMGSLFGVGAAWIALNRRWLGQVLSGSSATAPDEEDEEDEE